MGDKGKNLSIKEYLDMIRPYLSDIINDHKTQGECRMHSSNTIIKDKTQGERKIQLILLLLKKILMRLVPCIQKVII